MHHPNETKKLQTVYYKAWIGSTAVLLLCLVVSSACAQQAGPNEGIIEQPVQEQAHEQRADGLTRDMVYEKVLGMLVGSAIGDALGAPTEMWPR